jgi:hypothetical protein
LVKARIRVSSSAQMRGEEFANRREADRSVEAGLLHPWRSRMALRRFLHPGDSSAIAAGVPKA